MMHYHDQSEVRVGDHVWHGRDIASVEAIIERDQIAEWNLDSPGFMIVCERCGRVLIQPSSADWEDVSLMSRAPTDSDHFPTSHWKSGTFWASAIFGWLVTMIILAVLIRIFGSDEMTTAEGIIVNVAHQLLSLAAGYEYGKRQFQRRKPRRFGFPVIIKDSGNEDAK